MKKKNWPVELQERRRCPFCKVYLDEKNVGCIQDGTMYFEISFPTINVAFTPDRFKETDGLAFYCKGCGERLETKDDWISYLIFMHRKNNGGKKGAK